MMREWFRKFAAAVSERVASPVAFAAALGLIVLWALSGPLLHYSSTWQLLINTGTTVVTFLMVFILQSTQHRDTKAIQIKLDELLRAVHGARTNLVNLEEMSDEELDRLHHEFQRLRRRVEHTAEGTGVRET